MINLNENRKYIQSYIDLRNKYTDELSTKIITVESTARWLDSPDAGKISCEIENEKVVAAVIVHRRREVTVFSEKRGMGDLLLKEAEKMAFSLGFNEIYAKTKEDNIRSKELFVRNGYFYSEGIYTKHIHDTKKYGFVNGAEDFPRMVVLSFSYTCNSRCPNCPYRNSTIRDKYINNVFFEEKMFKKIADECGEHRAVLRLTGGGEPTLHKDIVSFTEYASKKGCKVSIITNGSSDVSDLLEIADMIEFSVDAGNEEEYKKVRPGLSWCKLNTNIANAFAKRKKTKLICSIINQRGIDVEGAKMYWSFLDIVQIRKFLTWGYNEDRSANKNAYLDDSIPCPWLWERISIDTKGDVTYCPEDIAFNYKFANINNTSIKDIWHSNNYKKMRDKHISGKISDVEMCKKCPDKKFRSWNFNYYKMAEYADNNITT